MILDMWRVWVWVCVCGGGGGGGGILPLAHVLRSFSQLEVASAGPCIYLGSQSSCDTHPGSPLA